MELCEPRRGRAAVTALSPFFDYDLFVIDRVADRLIVFEGTSGEHRKVGPQPIREGMNAFLEALGITPDGTLEAAVHGSTSPTVNLIASRRPTASTT